ncbi:virulence factor mce family protein [Mycolicibacterium flavescens]|uniref:MCE family protein n=1 Tax=Mycobacterium neumannii TaxID=2048551 RepID=UPI000B9421C3|nr:MlaD family protein [Mycobacterium neumannii]VEG43607.1 virulence factor mce family protein [Mycolicibacterium flavescens]
MRSRSWIGLKFGVFAAVMVLLTAMLFAIFAQYRTGPTNGYSAIFADVSGLKAGDSVRAAGLRVGTVTGLTMRPDSTVVVRFDADRHVLLSKSSKAAVRYLNLVGDRFLELLDAPGAVEFMAAGSQIPVDRTLPALDLDQLLSGLRPVISGLNPHDVNALTASLLQIFQGQGGTVSSVLSATASFSNDLANNNQTVQDLIDNLNKVMAALAKDGNKFSETINRFEQLVHGLADDRDPIGAAIDSLSTGTASVASLLDDSRAPLAATVDELGRLAPLLDKDKDLLDSALVKAPHNYRKLVRLGAYGSWLNYYICELSLRLSDLQGRTVVIPWIKQQDGRCAEP